MKGGGVKSMKFAVPWRITIGLEFTKLGPKEQLH